MFDIKSYVILLNEVFITGNSDESLAHHMNALLEAEQEPVKPHGGKPDHTFPSAEQYTRNVRFHESYEW